MIFTETIIQGALVIDIERHEDERGFFARSFCKKEFAKYGLCTDFVQNNISYNKNKGTIRGMHYQDAPYEEIKLVSCIKGSVYDVIVDIRKNSPSYGKWLGINLSENNNRSIYIPQGVAHGFQTLEDESTLFYMMSEFYHPESARGIRCDDKTFKIDWPIKELIMSDKDKTWPLDMD